MLSTYLVSVKEEEEEEFYMLLTYDKNRHVVIREAPLAQQLNHNFIPPTARQPLDPETLPWLAVNHSTGIYTLPGFVQIRPRA